MRIVSVAANHPPARRHAPLLSRSLLACLLYTTPFALLCLRLWHEMQAGTLPLDGSAVLVRFIVVGAFALLLSRWALHAFDGK